LGEDATFGMFNLNLGIFMKEKLKICCDGFSTLVDISKDNPQTTEKIIEALPLEGNARIYKQEIYFAIPVDIDAENSTMEIDKGDVAIWPQGNAFCIFFGHSDPVSPVNKIGEVKQNVDSFKEVNEGDDIRVEIY